MPDIRTSRFAAVLPLLASGLAFGGCANGASQANENLSPAYNAGDVEACPEMFRQISNSPEQDARASFGRGDTRVVGPNSDGGGVPGLSNDDVVRLEERGVRQRQLEGFHDAFDNRTCFRFMDSAVAYMERYNREMLRLIAQRERR